MHLVTNEEMKRIDEETIAARGIPSLALMERAGYGTAYFTQTFLGEKDKKKRVYIICGTGNNGGDGWVAGRFLNKVGYEVEFGLIGEKNRLSEDSKVNYNKIAKLKLPVEELNHVPDLSEYDLIMDAVLGTGFKGEPRGLLKEIIRYVNLLNIPVVAVDMPSGVNGTTGEVPGEAFISNMTVTMALPKLGQVLYPAKRYVGRLVVVDIGIPQDVIDGLDREFDYRLNHETELMSVFPQRVGDGHKGTFGKGVILSGSRGLTGAAALASESFLRSGAGYATLGLPASLNDIMEAKVTEVITHPLPESKKRRALAVRGLGEIMKMLKDADSAVIGPGISTHNETVDLIHRLVQRIEIPFTLDADALNAMSEAEDDGIWDKIKAPCVITPHFGELSRLLKTPIPKLKDKRLTHCKKWAKKFGCALVLKGAPTIIVSSDSPVYINGSGNDGLATAGSGDVLSGLIGGFLAQGLEALDAARLGVFVHGLAADIAVSNTNKYNLLASDLLDYLPDVFQVFIDMAPKDFVT